MSELPAAPGQGRRYSRRRLGEHGPVDQNVQHISTTSTSFDLRDGKPRELGVVDRSHPQAGVSPLPPVRVASAEASSAVAHGVEVLRRLGECIWRPRGFRPSHRRKQAIPALLVEIGRYDCGILWAVAGDRLKPVSAAFAYHTKPSSIALAWLASSRPCSRSSG